MRRPQDHLYVKAGDKVYYSQCDTSASVVWGSDAVIEERDGELWVITSTREDKLSSIDGCYAFLEIRNDS